VLLPQAQAVFGAATPLAWEWGLVFLLALTPVTIIEAGKLLRALFARGSSAQ